MTELAKRAGIAKSTLSQLEAGSGNPSPKRCGRWRWRWTPVSRLISPSRQVQVIRAHEGTPALSEWALRRHAAGDPAHQWQRDIYRLRVQPGEAKLSRPHPRHRRACDYQQRASTPGPATSRWS